ncbi:diguanylate cyclase domain-containing protein [Paenibacillus macerans]|uniref:sensor domain-containing diguanylate cyclase n=1 Tax=Paenibacillus macerans TaxID=44252 RepID=UPI003D31430E
MESIRYKVNIVLKNIAVLLLYASFLFIESRFFADIPYSIQLLLCVIMIVLTYFVASPVWMKSFPRKRKFTLYLMLSIVLILSYAWDLLRTINSANVFSIEIFMVPIVLALFFFSLKESIIVLMTCVLASAINVLVNVDKIKMDAVFSGLLQVGICVLIILVMDRALKVRSLLLNKQNILVENSRALIIGIDRNGRIDLCNPAMCRALNMKQYEVVDYFFWEVASRDINKDLDHVFQLLAQRKKINQLEMELTDRHLTSTFLTDTYPVDDDGLASGLIVVMNDITDRKIAEKKLYELSVTDDLTELSNRRHFEKRLDEEIARSNRYGHPLSLMLIDLDHFKQINDTYGHPFGDLVLTTVANQLKQHVRDTDLVARWGGEEFAILMAETDSWEAKNIGERLLETIEATSIPVMEGDVDSEFVHVTFSAGITTRTSDMIKEQIIESVDAALYASKNKGRNQVTLG